MISMYCMVHYALDLEGGSKVTSALRDHGEMVPLLYEETKRMWYYVVCCNNVDALTTV